MTRLVGSAESSARALPREYTGTSLSPHKATFWSEPYLPKVGHDSQLGGTRPKSDINVVRLSPADNGVVVTALRESAHSLVNNSALDSSVDRLTPASWCAPCRGAVRSRLYDHSRREQDEISHCCRARGVAVAVCT